MPQTLPNGVTTPINSDAYNLATDLATMGGSANVVIPVASQAARDALTLHTGLTVTRGDVPGQPIEIYNGSSWDRITQRVHATTATVGTAPTATSFTTGLLRPIIQAGSSIVTTDASGNVAINYPTAFPNGVVTATFANGDSNIGNLTMSGAGAFTQSVSTLFVNIKTANTGSAYASSTARVNWVAVGW